jgi:RNA polymerase sigma factor (sigma-70 family)
MIKHRKKDYLMDREREFENFFRANQNTLYRIILGYVGQPEASEDLAVEAFIKIFERWKKVRKMQNPTGYLVRSGINLAKTYLKKDSRVRTVEILENRASSPGDSPEEIFFENYRNQALGAELMKLNEKERNIVLLKDMSGHKFGEIAGILSMKLPTVKSIYRRTKIKLAGILEETDEP